MAIDRKKIIDEMSKITVEANADGIIPAFNVFVNQLPAILLENSFQNLAGSWVIKTLNARMIPSALASTAIFDISSMTFFLSTAIRTPPYASTLKTDFSAPITRL